MKKIWIVMLLMIILTFSACRWAYSYGVFPFVQNELSPEDVLSDPESEQYQIDGVAVVPVLKPADHKDYRLGFLAYSYASWDQIEINQVSLYNKDRKIPLQNDSIVISVSETTDGICRGDGRLCTIPMQTLHAVKGEEFTLTIHVTLRNEAGNVQQKTISYQATVLQSFLPVLPT